MPAIEDHDYLKICAHLATSLSISLSAARRKVEIQAARDGVRDLAARKLIAEDLLQAANQKSEGKEVTNAMHFDKLLAALVEEENFMVED